MNKVTGLDYCQCLWVSQRNYTMRYFAEHSQGFSHDAVKRYLEKDKLTARMVWENVRGQVVRTQEGYLAFDDTVLDHNSSFKIELVRREYSGNAHEIIKGIGVVTCVYINPETEEFWIIDYRIYDPERDGKTKLDHVREMLDNALTEKCLPFRGVLMDSWYAERKLILHIERLKKVYYCPLKDNRHVDDSDEERGYQRVDSLNWSDEEIQHGKTLHIKDFPKGHRVELFRRVLSATRTECIATTVFTPESTQHTQEVLPFPWKMCQFHAEPNQTPRMK